MKILEEGDWLTVQTHIKTSLKLIRSYGSLYIPLQLKLMVIETYLVSTASYLGRDASSPTEVRVLSHLSWNKFSLSLHAAPHMKGWVWIKDIEDQYLSAWNMYRMFLKKYNRWSKIFSKMKLKFICSSLTRFFRVFAIVEIFGKYSIFGILVFF